MNKIQAFAMECLARDVPQDDALVCASEEAAARAYLDFLRRIPGVNGNPWTRKLTMPKGGSIRVVTTAQVRPSAVGGPEAAA